MNKCALLTMDNLDDFECYDQLLAQPMIDKNWLVEDISWRAKGVDWNQFDAVIVRSPWDYQDDYQAFMSVLKEIETSKALLINDIRLMEWNVNKQYLYQLEQRGVNIVPTQWHQDYSEEVLSKGFKYFDTQQLILKPCVSAGASDTFWLKESDDNIEHDRLIRLFKSREFMLQPFIPHILSEGEFSLFYFDNQYSHAIVKKPKSSDFRVQEEHGGQLLSIEPEWLLTETAETVLENLPYPAMYARLDFVRYQGQFALMEAELIEPSLYFNMDVQSAKRFTEGFVEYYRKSV